MPFSGDDIHYRHDRWRQMIIMGDKAAALRQMKAACKRGEADSHFACYNAGIVLIHSDRREARRLFSRALELKPDYAEAANAVTRYGGKLSNRGIITMIEEVQKAAERRNSRKLYRLMAELAEEKALSRDFFMTDSSFRAYRKNKTFLRYLDRFRPVDTDAFIRAGVRTNPVAGFIDTTYTLKVHRKKPEKKQVLYHYYNALVYTDKGAYRKASLSLKYFIKKLEQLAAADKNAGELPRYAIIYLTQEKRFRKLRKKPVFRDWFLPQAEAYSIEESWLEKYL